MKNSTGIIVAVIVVLAIIGIGIAATNRPGENAGHLTIGITDATANIANVDEVYLTVDKVELYSEAEGWMTVSSNSETYPLLELKASGEAKLYAEKDVAADIYNKVRVTLRNAEVRTKAQGDVDAVMPSEEVVMDTNLKVRAGENSHLTLDFKADKSLHSTSGGKYVFAAVVEQKAESGVMVRVAEDGTILEVTGGTVDSSTSVGVDLTGASKVNFVLTTDASLNIKSIEGDMIIFTLGGAEIISGSAFQEESTNIEAEGEGEGNLENDMIDREEEQEKSGAGAGVNVESGTKVNAY